MINENSACDTPLFNLMKKFYRLRRGIAHVLLRLVYEFPKGLDFYTRNLEIRSNQNNGYAATSGKSLKYIATFIPFRDKNFIDVGSGKGLACRNALNLGAKHVTGLEVDQNLHNIASSNFRKLKERRITLLNMDARNFKQYADFDIIFIFNPFPRLIYEEWLGVVLKQLKLSNKTTYLVLYGESHDLLIEAPIVYNGICPYRKNKILIYKVTF